MLGQRNDRLRPIIMRKKSGGYMVSIWFNQVAFRPAKFSLEHTKGIEGEYTMTKTKSGRGRPKGVGENVGN